MILGNIETLCSEDIPEFFDKNKDVILRIYKGISEQISADDYEDMDSYNEVRAALTTATLFNGDESFTGLTCTEYENEELVDEFYHLLTIQYALWTLESRGLIKDQS